jgi:hypothetical protein
LQDVPGVFMQTLLVSRDVMQRCGGFDLAMRMAMDTDFTFRPAAPCCAEPFAGILGDRFWHRTCGGWSRAGLCGWRSFDASMPIAFSRPAARETPTFSR